MLKNFFRIAWRNLIKNPAHSAINIAGLSVGMGVALLIGLWISDELSFDRSNPHYERIAQVKQNVTNNTEIQTWPNLPYPLAGELRKSYGGDFRQVVMGTQAGSHILYYGDKQLRSNGSYYEPDITTLLNLTMTRGKMDGLHDPSSILLSRSMARAIFGDADPVNKVIKIDNTLPVKVTGVYQDLPDNSSFADLDFIAPWELYYASTDWVRTIQDPWRPNAFQIFVELADNTDINKVSAKIKDAKLNKVNKDLAKKRPALFLQPMSRWHLYGEYKDGVNTGGRITYVWLFGIIGLFVLLLACINFMNLSTARSEKRAREVGIRKAIGSLRWQLIGQFFSESMLVVIFAFVLSVLLVEGALPFFNTIAGKKISIPWGDPVFWILSVAFGLITAIVAGSYPALYLSSFRPVSVLKGTFRSGPRAAIPRRILVVLQFTVSVVMIIGTIVVFHQIQFAKDRPTGYSKDGLVSIPVGTPDIHRHFNAVKDELIQAGAITGMTEAGNSPTETAGTTSGFDWKGKNPNLSIDFQTMDISYDYGKTIGSHFLGGRDFSRDFATDSQSLVLNASAIRFMGLKNPIGETIRWFGNPFTIIGVVDDIVVQSPYEQVKPTVFYLNNDPGYVAILKLNPAAGPHEALGKIEKTFKSYNPTRPFEYKFVDEDYNKKFGNEERIGRLASAFAVLAIFISCLGLFGMASFMAEQRIKEIGVRKVLGASVWSLWTLLSKDFLGLVGISLLIATPTSWYLMHNWLRNFTYRSDIAWWFFAVTGAGTLLITLITVSFQAIKAALANPVKSLRSE